MNILYVEDDRVISEFAKHIFLESRHTLIWADCVECAVDALSKGNKIDLVLLDLKLGNGHGFELLDFMKDTSRKTPVIVISGQVDTYKREITKYTKSGAILSVYVKPIKFDSLIKDIDRLFPNK